MRRFASVLSVAALAVAGLVGCGDDSSETSPSESDDAATVAIVAVNQQLTDFATNGDAKGFCSVVAPSQRKKLFRKTSCEKTIAPLLKGQKMSPSLFKIESVDVNGESADVGYEGRPGPTKFVNEDGNWYLGNPAP